NYDDEKELTDITTLDEMKELWAPEINKSNNLDPLNGFCMYGSLPDVDFTDVTNYPVTVGLVRTCAKLRVNLTFPGNSLLSINNSFLIQRAATYTHVVPNSIVTLPMDNYFNFAAALPLTDNGAGVYTGNTYVYEANQAPVITIYTHLGGSTEEQAFTATLPVPQRNYLYDLIIEVYEEGTALRSVEKGPGYAFYSTIRVYNEAGELVEETSF
ncbi:MAG: hypothetical protein LUD15_03975, partial [Bacteroides sp.]|nr:hypothetical protein [Bacteroides sp.]